MAMARVYARFSMTITKMCGKAELAGAAFAVGAIVGGVLACPAGCAAGLDDVHAPTNVSAIASSARRVIRPCYLRLRCRARAAWCALRTRAGARQARARSARPPEQPHPPTPAR